MSDIKIKITDQFRIIHDPKVPEETKVPTMPLLVILDNEIIGETNSIRGAATIVIGNEYLDSEDALDEWHLRLQTARFEAMKALRFDKEVVVCDSRKGIIPNNYAIGKGDPDYIIEPDEDIQNVEEILIDNDRLFLFSLAKIGAIRLLEREDSYLFRPHAKWAAINGGELKKCSSCIHRIEHESKIICPVYNIGCDEKTGSNCGSYSIDNQNGKNEYTGGVYIDICMEYGSEVLLQRFK